jgi:hypothetical protein
MNARFLCLAALTGRMVCASQAPSAFPDTAGLAAELHRLEEVAAEGGLRQAAASLPSSWMVDAGGKRYLISTAPLRNLTSSPDQARTWLHQLELQIESYSSAPAKPAESRAKLSAILARREFAAAKPPGPLEVLWEMIGNWIRDFLLGIFALTKRYPAGASALFWLTALGAIGFLGVWLLRLWTDGRRILRPESETASAAPGWQRWAAMAQEARDRGDFREAIHCVYWAAVVNLQSLRSLPEDRTRTPRELLRLLPGHDSSRPPLAALTSALERFWYADRPVSPDDLRESFDQLEALGCSRAATASGNNT